MVRLRGKPRTLEGLPGQWQEVAVHYDATKDAHHCPICAGVGWVWQGLFTCDGTCGAVALLSEGRVFVPAAPIEGDADVAG